MSTISINLNIQLPHRLILSLLCSISKIFLILVIFPQNAAQNRQFQESFVFLLYLLLKFFKSEVALEQVPLFVAYVCGVRTQS